MQRWLSRVGVGVGCGLIATAAMAAGPASVAGVRWQRSFDAAAAEARRLDRPLVIDFWAEWCGWCHTLDATTYVDPEVVALLRGFVPVKVNTEGSRAEAEVAMRYGVTSLPTIAFVSPQGRMLLRVSGYQPPQVFTDTIELAKQKGAEVRSWDRALAKNASDPAALAGLGLHLLEQEAFDEGIELLTRARQADGSLPSAQRKRVRLALGVLRRAERRFDESEALLQEALRLEPEDAEADAQVLFVLGRLYLSWGKIEQGVSTLKKLISDHPGSPASARARQTLAYIEPSS